ncbi:MAG TPA: hypothetical protein VGN52_00215 [Burkholderiales bacterium]
MIEFTGIRDFAERRTASASRALSIRLASGSGKDILARLCFPEIDWLRLCDSALRRKMMSAYKCKNPKCLAVSEATAKPKSCGVCRKSMGFELVPDTSEKGAGGFQLGQAWSALQTANAQTPLQLLPLVNDAHLLLTTRARDLRIASVASQAGMTFNSAEFKDGETTQGYVTKTPITKGSSGICYENMVLPSPVPAAPKFSIYLIHQSLAPCRLCRRGYSNWAKELQSTIVVAFDDGHDGLAANGALVFCPDLQIFQI